MNPHMIQFLGIVLWVTSGVHMEAIFPNLPDHSALVLVPADASETATRWTYTALTDATGKHWHAYELHGETVRFGSTGPDLTMPVFLAHVNDDCCRLVGSVRDEYGQLERPVRTSAHIFLQHGDMGWTDSGGRIDTVVQIASTDPEITITATLGATIRTLTFRGDAVIANAPRNVLESGGGTMAAHFKSYYDMVTFGLICKPFKRTAPNMGGKCNARNGDYPTLHREPLINKGFVYLTAIDVGCSNSQYP